MHSVWNKFFCMTILALCVGRWLHAQTVSVQVASQEAFVDEPVRVVVNVENAIGFDGPFVAEVDGVEFRRLPGEQSFTQRQNINGRVTEKTTVGIAYEVTPRRAGSFTIPAFTINFNGKTLSTKPFRLTAVVSETGDLMTATVTCDPPTMYVGQTGTLNLELAVKRFRDEQLAITLDEGSLWSLVSRDASSWGVFGPALDKLRSENRRPRGEPRMIGDAEYIVFTIAKPFDPIAAGAPAIGDVRVRMDYPTRLTRGNDGFFENRLSLAGSRPISIVPTITAIDVQSPPEGGRPASWNGAVGRFTIDVAAKPVDVTVGDPITLTLRLTDLSGTAGLEGLQSPALFDQPSLSQSFRVPRESAAGVVEGRAKIFTQSVRALNDAVNAIPAIEFSFFDPETGSYELIQSEALPLRVTPSAVARIGPEAGVEAPVEVASTLTKIEGGLLANASIDDLIGIPANPADIVVSALIGPSCLALACGIRLWQNATSNHPLARRRRGARGACERRLATTPTPDGVSTALLGYIADRVGAPEGSLTRREAIDVLAMAGVEPEARAEVDLLLRRCERGRYAGESIDTREVIAILARLDAMDWKDRGGQ